MQKVIAIIIGCAVVATSCSKQPESANADGDGEARTPVIYTVNYPLQYFAERIGGDRIEVSYPGPTDEDPAYWVPGVDDLSAYQQANLILLNGAGYAKWIDKVSLPESRMIHTGRAFDDELIALDSHATHSHGPSGEHAHGGVAFTTWLDPQLAGKQARVVASALGRIDPEGVALFNARLKELAQDLAGLDTQFARITSSPAQPVIFSHPVYQYLARRYRLNGRSVHWEPGLVPTEDQWTELKAILGDHPARWMIWEGEPIPETVEKLKTLGVASVVFSPCGTPPDDGDYLTVMHRNAHALRKVFASQP